VWDEPEQAPIKGVHHYKFILHTSTDLQIGCLGIISTTYGGSTFLGCLNCFSYVLQGRLSLLLYGLAVIKQSLVPLRQLRARQRGGRGQGPADGRERVWLSRMDILLLFYIQKLE